MTWSPSTLGAVVGAALTNLGDGTIPILTTALTAQTADRRRVAAYALGSMGPKAAAAAEALAKALQYDDPANAPGWRPAPWARSARRNSTLPQLEKH